MKPLFPSLTLSRVLLFSAFLLFLLGALASFPFTTDDSFITYRYALNLAHGHGAVYNVGEWIEGYSNPLWMLLLTPFAWLGWSLPLVSKVLGVLCGLILLRTTYSLLHDSFSLSETDSTWGALLLSVNTSVVVYAVSGMETLLYSTLILLFFQQLLTNRLLTASLLASAILLTRPEGVMILAPLAIGLWRTDKRKLFWLLVPVGVLLAEFLIDRLDFFEDVRELVRQLGQTLIDRIGGLSVVAGLGVGDGICHERSHTNPIIAPQTEARLVGSIEGRSCRR